MNFKYWFLSVFISLICLQNENNGVVSGDRYYYSYYGSSYRAPVRVTARSTRAYSLSRLGPYYHYYYNFYFKVANERTTRYSRYSSSACLNLEGNVTTSTFLGYFSCPLANSSDPFNHTSCCGDSLAQYCCPYSSPDYTPGRIIGFTILAVIGAVVLMMLYGRIKKRCKKAKNVRPLRTVSANVTETTARIRNTNSSPTSITPDIPLGYSEAPPPYPGTDSQPSTEIYPPDRGVAYPPQGVNVPYNPPSSPPPSYAEANAFPSVEAAGDWAPSPRREI